MEKPTPHRRVSFSVPKTLVIDDQILQIRRTIPFYENLSLYMLPRFHYSPSPKISKNPSYYLKVKSRVNNQYVDIFTPLREQGIYPGDILVVYR
jgi:hypothetical protein